MDTDAKRLQAAGDGGVGAEVSERGARVGLAMGVSGEGSGD
jgi:hypothetical protein